MIKKLLLVLCVLLIVSAGFGWTGYRMYETRMTALLPLDQPRELHVETGTWFRQFADQLAQEGFIDNPAWLRLEARLNPAVTAIKAGEYRLEPGMTLRDLLDLIVSGDTIKYSFTLIEGSTFKQLQQRLLDDMRLQHKLGDMDEQAILAELNVDKPSAEGLFLAETYHFERGTSDLELLKRAHADLNQVLAAAWAERQTDPKLPLDTAYEALILASIIEKETGVPEERPQIAGVFVRRMEQGMRLQTDPTVIYGMGDRYKGNITRADLRRPTPWNTYVIDGLPPTPIALVGREAIEAALHPAPGKALYFVAKGDGTHQFSNTLNEHNKAVRRYQLSRRDNYRSSPEEK